MVAARPIAPDAARRDMVAALELDVAADLQIGAALDRTLIRPADHVVCAAGRILVDRSARREHHIRAVHVMPVSAAVERLTQLDLAVLCEDRPLSVAIEPCANHLHVFKRTRPRQFAVRAAHEDAELVVTRTPDRKGLAVYPPNNPVFPTF